MIVFALDGLVSLLFQDLIGVLAHAVVLFFMARGYMAGRERWRWNERLRKHLLPLQRFKAS